MNMQTQEEIRNGINVTKLVQTVEAVAADPALGVFKPRARSQWMGADHSRFSIHDFYAGKQEMTHERRFEMSTGEPAFLLGQDKGANPVEYVLGALSGCMTTTLSYKSAAEGFTLTRIESEMEGDIDLRGIFGIDETVERGFSEIRAKFKITGDISPERAKELMTYSPVVNTLKCPLKVSVEVMAARE